MFLDAVSDQLSTQVQATGAVQTTAAAAYPVFPEGPRQCYIHTPDARRGVEIYSPQQPQQRLCGLAQVHV